MENSGLTRYQKGIIAILAISQFTVVLDFMVMSPLGDFLIKTMNITPQQFGFAVSSYAFSAGISGLLAAGFADNFDRKKLLLFFYTGFILGTFFCAIATNYTFLIAARIFTGLFGGVIGSVVMAIITDLFTIEHRGRVMGFVQMGFAASQVLGIPVGIYLANLWDWHAPFFMIVGLSTLIAVTIFLFMKPVVKHLEQQSSQNFWEHFKAVATNKRYRIGFLATAFLSIGGFLLMPFGSAFAINNLKVSPSQLPMIFMATGISSIIIMPVVGKLCDKYDKFKIFVTGTVWASIFILIYTHLTAVPIWMIMSLNILLFMGIMSRMIPASIIMTGIPKMQDRGAFMSINSSLQQMSGGLAAALAGTIVVQKDKFSPLEHYPVLGYISVVVMVICVLLVYRASQLVREVNA